MFNETNSRARNFGLFGEQKEHGVDGSQSTAIFPAPVALWMRAQKRQREANATAKIFKIKINNYVLVSYD